MTHFQILSALCWPMHCYDRHRNTYSMRWYGRYLSDSKLAYNYAKNVNS